MDELTEILNLIRTLQLTMEILEKGFANCIEAVIAIEKKVGVNNSSDPTSIDFKISRLEEHVYHDHVDFDFNS